MSLRFFQIATPRGVFVVCFAIFSKNKRLYLSEKRGEKAAIKYLKKNGYSILASNFYNKSGRRMGEIDIIAKEEGIIVFVEVKTRTMRPGRQPLPEESISPIKLHKINKAALCYLSKNNITKTPYRFDAITLLADIDNKSASLRHLKDIFF